MDSKRFVAAGFFLVSASLFECFPAHASGLPEIPGPRTDIDAIWKIELPLSPSNKTFAVTPGAERNADASNPPDTTGDLTFPTPRRRVADFAMRFRDILYRRGGRDPSTGFDCSGFTHYVYEHTYGLNLPYDAPSQFLNGKKITRGELRAGDLVFFRNGRGISHVGLYVGGDRFIHSPSPGKRVRVDNLDARYWLPRFAGARRPQVEG